jgi:hypothetical protein
MLARHACACPLVECRGKGSRLSSRQVAKTSFPGKSVKTTFLFFWPCHLSCPDEGHARKRDFQWKASIFWVLDKFGRCSTKISAFSWGRTDFPWIWKEPKEPMPVIWDFRTESSAKTYPGVPRQDMLLACCLSRTQPQEQAKNKQALPKLANHTQHEQPPWLHGCWRGLWQTSCARPADSKEARRPNS